MPDEDLARSPAPATWVSRNRAADALVQADAQLTSELAEVLDGTIDEVWPPE